MLTLVRESSLDGVLLQKVGVELLEDLPEGQTHVTHGCHSGHNQRPARSPELQLQSVMGAAATCPPLHTNRLFNASAPMCHDHINNIHIWRISNSTHLAPKA